MKHIKWVILLFCTLLADQLGAQTPAKRLPLIIERGYPTSRWDINDGIAAKVYLEMGLRKIVFDEEFVLNNMDRLGIELIQALPADSVTLLQSQPAQKVLYYIKGTLLFNGHSVPVDGLVVSGINIGESRQDVAFPLPLFAKKVELNMAEKWMSIYDRQQIAPEFTSHAVSFEPRQNGMYINTSFTCYDEWGKPQILEGEFLLNLRNGGGLGGLLTVNTNTPEGNKFVLDCMSMITNHIRPTNSDYKEVMMTFSSVPIVVMGHLYKWQLLSVNEFTMTDDIQKFLGEVGLTLFTYFTPIFDFKQRVMHLKVNDSPFLVRRCLDITH